MRNISSACWCISPSAVQAKMALLTQTRQQDAGVAVAMAITSLLCPLTRGLGRWPALAHRDL